MQELKLPFFVPCFLSLVLAISPAVQAENLLLTGATVHTVSGETFAPGQVWMKDGKIADDIVANAPAREDHFFVVPKVVE